MIKKSTEMAYTSKQIKSSKWLLLLCAASAAAVDLAIMILLIIGGMGATYLVCPIVLFVFDVAYFVVSLVFTNFRFKYSLWVWLSYIILFALGVAIELVLILGGTGTVISNSALAVWSAVHALNIVCAIVTSLFASRVLKKIWVGIVCAVIFILCCAAYLAHAFLFGFFGQGMSTRPLVFKYDSATGEYTAIDVIAGRSDTVSVPKTFNGKPVTALSFKVLENSGIKEYTFSADIRFTDEEVLATAQNITDKKIFVDKDAVNEVRATLFGFEATAANGNAVALANATLPANLAEGEGYVAFSYDLNSYNLSKGNVIPVYVGDLAAFDIDAYTADYDYITYRNADSADDLDRAFRQGGYILNDIVGENGSILSGGVTQNTIAQLKFDKVYRITVTSGNDELYNEREVQPDFCFDTVGGQELTYRYVTLNTAKSFTSGLNARKGFSLSWVYQDGSSSQTLDDLSATLGDINGSDLTISPVWALNAPEVSIQYSAKEITYGEDVTFNAIAEIEAEGVVLEYRWSLGGDPVTDYAWNEDSVELTHPKIEEGGEYKLVVLVTGGEVTSLTAEGRASVMLSIAKKPVEFVWTTPDDLVYDGGEKVVTFTFDNDQLVGDDSIQYAVPVGGEDHGFLAVGAGTYTVKYAGTYSPEIMVSGADAVNYDAGDSLHFTFTVAKRAVDVVWSNYDNLVYNAALQGPSASAMGVSVDGDVIEAVTGQKTDAGANYTATATLNNSNYTLNNPTQVYSIAKAPLTVTAGEASTEYGNAPDESAITLGYSGFVGEENKEVLGGAPAYTFVPSLGSGDYSVGTYSEGVVVSGYTSNNYEITYVSGTLDITQRVVTLGWSNADNLVYDAQAKNVGAYVANVVGSDDVAVTVTGGNQTAHGTYTAEAVALTGTRASNYKLDGQLTREYVIEKAVVTITADDKTSVYGSDTVELSSTVSGTIYNDEIEFEISSEIEELEKLDAADYDIICTLTLDNDNYDVRCVNGTYTVTPLAVTIVWHYDRYVYNGEERSVTATVTNKAFEEDEVNVVVEGGNEKDAGGHIATAVSLDGEQAGNYVLPEGLTQEYHIDPVQVSINIDNKTSVYGDELEELTVTINGSIYNDEIVYELKKEAGLDVGTYKITCTITKGLLDSNYQLSDYFVSGTYTITAREISVEWSGYENLVYDATEKTITATVNNLAEGDEDLVSFTGIRAIEAGDYTAQIVLDASIAGNYTVVNGTLKYTVRDINDTDGMDGANGVED